MRKLRIILVWTLVSLFLQGGAYSLLNNKIRGVMAPLAASEPITLNLTATIPGTNLENIQISYAKDYLAYTENGTFKFLTLYRVSKYLKKNLLLILIKHWAFLPTIGCPTEIRCFIFIPRKIQMK